jgi:hypothetical protein
VGLQIGDNDLWREGQQATVPRAEKRLSLPTMSREVPPRRAASKELTYRYYNHLPEWHKKYI